MNFENVIKTCYVALSDIMEEDEDENGCDDNNNDDVDRGYQSEMARRFQLKPCHVQVERLAWNSIKDKEQELIKKFNLKECLVYLKNVNRREFDRFFSMATGTLDGVIVSDETSDQNESVQSNVPRFESSHMIVNDRALQQGAHIKNRDAHGEFCTHHTQFAVDDFMSPANHYFLTRFHPDQYAGLTAEFNGFIYTSKITAYLVQKIIGVHGSFVRILNNDVPIIVDDVQITAITVPSYPGALMIMFKTMAGRVEIHANYMHTSAELEENSTMWNNAHVDALVIHNNPSVLEQSNWPQDEYLYRKEMSKIIDQHMKDQRRRGLVGLIVFNAHRNMYAMEKFYVSLAQFHDLSIWTADENTKRLLTALSIEDGHISTILSDNPANAGIHILPDAKLEKDNLLEYLGHFDTVHHILAFRTNIDNTAMNLSLKRPIYNRFPLIIYNIPNPFVTNNEEYLRFARFLGITE